MTTSTGLIVLHTTKFGENSVIVHTLSREYGRRGFLVRGLGKKSSMAFFQPLSLIEADITVSSKSELYTARRFFSRHPLNGIRSSMSKNAMSMFMAEVLFRTLKDGTTDQNLFDWCERNIMLLDAIEQDFSNFHIRFLLEFAIALGFRPESHNMEPFTGDLHDIARKFISSSFAESMIIPLTGAVRNELAEKIIRYIEFHTESAINVNSLKVLRELFA